MPKEPLSLEKFNLGLITAIDPQDIPKDACSYSENLDGNVTGRLQGILANSLKSSSVGISAVGINGWLRRQTGEHDLIYTDNTNIKAILDFYGTPSDSTLISSKVPTSMVALNQSMHMGTGAGSTNSPQFFGRTVNAPFGGIGQVVFSGTVNDLVAKGYYTGSANATYYVEILSLAPDTARWKKDAGSWTNFTIASGTWYDIAEGISVFFTTGGWSADESWEIPVSIPSSREHAGNAQLSLYEETSAYTDPTAGYFGLSVSAGSGTVLRRYKYSLIYDGIQESLLCEGDYDNNVTSVGDSTTVNLYAGKASSSLASFNKRITGINLYQATSLTGDEADLGQFRLVRSILIGNGDEWVSSTSNNKVIATTDTGLVSVSYEQNSGVQENADVNLPNYTLGVSLNNAHFIANCYVEEIPDAKMMLFKSVDFCYDVFDIYNDKCYLNIIPTAMAGFNNKIYVWDANTTVIVNASNLAIENIVYGTGCLSQTGWTIIDTIIDDRPFRALVFADANDIYMDDGTGARPISGFIRKKVSSTSIDWQGMQHTSISPILVYDAVKNTLLCISSVNYAGNVASVLAFNIISRRWDYYPDFCNYSSTSYLCKSAFAGKNGETYSVTGSQVLNNFGSTTNRAWKYYSPELTFDLPKQPKKFYNMYLDKVETSGTITPTYSINKGSSYRSLTNTTEIKDVSAKWEKQNSIILALSATAGVNYVNAIELLYRKMVGVR